MSQGRGSIPERIRRALYVLSRGRCYAPNCDEPVLVIDGEEVVFVGNVAHIIAASPEGPRGTRRPVNAEARSDLVLATRTSAYSATLGWVEVNPQNRWEERRLAERVLRAYKEFHRHDENWITERLLWIYDRLRRMVKAGQSGTPLLSLFHRDGEGHGQVETPGVDIGRGSR